MITYAIKDVKTGRYFANSDAVFTSYISKAKLYDYKIAKAVCDIWSIDFANLKVVKVKVEEFN